MILFKSRKEKAYDDALVNNRRAIRLIFAYVQPYKNYYENKMKCGSLFISSSAFKLPDYMTMKEACKIVSYLSEKVEKENNIEPASKESVGAVSKILENYGFVKTNLVEPEYYHSTSKFSDSLKITFNKPAIDGVVDLITIGGSTLCFKRTDLYPRYFNWFTKNVKEDEIKAIYKAVQLINQIFSPVIEANKEIEK